MHNTIHNVSNILFIPQATDFKKTSTKVHRKEMLSNKKMKIIIGVVAVIMVIVINLLIILFSTGVIKT